jgi:hypothetical protein
MNSDYLELLQCFADFKVRYLIVGGYAVIHYAEPRYTKDLDIWIEASDLNGKRVLKALTQFGAPVANLTVSDLAKPGLLYVFGIPPLRVDVLNRLKGANFAAAWETRKRFTISGVGCWYVDKKTLIKLKRAAGLPQDKADLERLLE